MRKQPKNEIGAIEIGSVHTGYHDGKRGRPVKIKIDDVVSRYDMNKRGQTLWRKALKEDFSRVFNGCSFYCGPKGLFDPITTKQFWDWNCDTFIVGHIPEIKETKKNQMLFAKRPDGFGWYCINWNYSLVI